jgi:hypothetical protein
VDAEAIVDVLEAGRLAQYEALRDEMLRRASFQQALMALELTAVGTVVGFVLGKRSPTELLLVVPFISSTLGLLWLEHARHIGRIAQFIDEQLWARQQPSWETYRRSTENEAPWLSAIFWGSRLVVFFGASLATLLLGAIEGESAVAVSLLTPTGGLLTTLYVVASVRVLQVELRRGKREGLLEPPAAQPIDVGPGPALRSPAMSTQPPSSDPEAPRDMVGYRLAVASVGVSLVVFVVGAVVLAALGKDAPTQYWPFGTGLAGALFGILGTTPAPTTASKVDQAGNETGQVSIVRTLWKNRAVLILFTVFVVTAGFAVASSGKPSTDLLSLVTASGGVLIGLLTPSPGETGTNS